MDINSYSYINYSSSTSNLKRADIEDYNILYLDNEINYFQDKFFIVSDLYGDIYKTFEYMDIPLKNYDSREKALEKAVIYFNSFVSDKDKINLDTIDTL